MSLSKISAKEANTLPTSGQDIGDSDDTNELESNSNTDTENIDTSEQVFEFQEPNDNDNPPILTRMLNFCRELAIFCLIMIALEAVTKNPPKVTKPPAAYPFFPSDSLITDWYRGEISNAIEQARSSDIAFVMFYAPWDGESQAARKEFEATARYMQQYVTFAAVNCWQPNSECRNTYSKVYRWPIFIAYPSHGRGVQYNGPISTPHMIKFLLKMCQPFLRYNDDNLRESEDAYVVVSLIASPGNRDFAVFYTTTLKYLERDPLHSINFYIDSRPVYEPVLQLHLWNETFIYPLINNEWNPDEIVQWIFHHVHKVTSWVAPSWTKSYSLSRSLQPGPALILFTPKNPLHIQTDYYNMLQEVAYEYYNCENSFFVNLQALNIKLKRSANMLLHKNQNQKCGIIQNRLENVVSHLTPENWANSSSYAHIKNLQGYNSIEDDVNYFCNDLKNSECIECPPTFVDDEEKRCDRKFSEFYKTSILLGENDPRSAENLLKGLKEERCRQFLEAQGYFPAIFEDLLEVKTREKVNVTGLACATNASLTLIAMDSLLYYDFAERLGVDLSSKADRSSVVIVHEKMESHYILKAPINSVNLRHFIRNFTNEQLPRSLDSYGVVKERPEPVIRDKIEGERMIVVKELNTDTFLRTVSKKNKAVVVFYYSKQCAFCSGISYVLLIVAKKLSAVESLEFYRIDGDTNLLPWEYTMEKFPTILFFPAYDKSESRAYPSEIPITVLDLITFIVTNLDPAIKLHAMWSLCNQTKFEDEKQECLSEIQAETLTVIDSFLKQWRKSNARQRQTLLYKLRLLKQLHLLFAQYPRRHAMIQNFFKKLNSNFDNTRDYQRAVRAKRCKDEL